MTSIESEYDALLRAYPEKARRAVERLNPTLIRNGCRFGEQPIPCFLKPAFLTSQQTQEFEEALFHLTQMLEKVVASFAHSPSLRPLFGLSKKAEAFMRIDPGYRDSIVIARPDALWSRGRFRFVEFNCDSPAGSGYSDVQEQILKRSFVMRRLSKKYRWQSPKRLQSLLGALLDCYREFGGDKKYPQIAIVDWKHMRTYDEFILTQRYFESRGYPAFFADPRELRFRRGRLEARGRGIDLIYRRVIFNELWKKREETKDFFKAYAHGKVCVVNPLRSRLAANKAVLSILTNPDYDAWFSPREHAVRDRYLAWTRRMQDMHQTYRGKKIHLRDLARRNQRELVLKPADSYGGKDVSLGCEMPRAEWRKTMVRALRERRNWVVQEFVNIPKMTVPVVHKGKLKLVSKNFNINPFVFRGKYAGAMARLSDEPVINVSAGGGLIPAISFERR